MYIGEPVYGLKNTEYTVGICKGYVFKTQEEMNEETHVGFYIPKILPLIDATTGCVEDNEEVNTDIFANPISPPSSVPTANYIKAKYNGRSNFSQPMIALGETAQLIFFNNDYKQPRYLDSFNDERRRKTDKIKWYVNSKSDTDEDADSYYVELNSVDGSISIHTCTENGEEHAYDFKINTAESKIECKDDDGNEILLSTEDKLISLTNSSGSSIHISDKDIKCKCDGDYTVECDNFKVTANTTIEEKANSKIERSSPKISDSADAVYELKTAMVEANVSSMAKYTCPMFLVSGIIGAATLGISPSPASPPSVAMANSSKNTLTMSPTGVGALGDRALMALMAVLPFTTLPPVAAAIVAPLASQIPKPSVQL